MHFYCLLRLFCIVEFLKIDDVSVFDRVALEIEPHRGGLGVADWEHDPRKRNEENEMEPGRGTAHVRVGEGCVGGC